MRLALAAGVLLMASAGASTAALSGARPGADWGEVWIPRWELSLRAPGGWRLDCPLEGDTARLYSPQGTEVLVRVWEGPTALTAAEALAEYEQALGVSTTPDPPPQSLRAASGLAGAWVELMLDTGYRPLLAMAVFTAGTRRIVLAVHGEARYAVAARQRLEAMAVSLQLATGTPSTGTGVSPMVGPSEGAGFSPTQEPPVTAVVPPVSEAPPERVTSGPFSLAVPRGYEVRLERGTLWVDAPDRPGGYFLWPARDSEDDLPLSELPALWARQAGVELTPRMSRSAGAGTLAAGILGREQKLRALLYAWRGGDSLLLAGIYAPAATWAAQAPGLAQWLAAAQCSGWRPADLPVPFTPVTWSDEAGALSLHLPENWTARGGVGEYQAQPLLKVTAEGEGIRFTWRQPYAPAFRDLTPILQAMGQAEGTAYREGEGEDHLLVLARRSPARLVEWLLQQPEEGWTDARVTRVEKNAAVAALLPGLEKERDGAVVWVNGLREGQAREATYLCATAPLPLEQGAFRWRATVLAVEYPPGQARRALGALRSLLGTAALPETGEVSRLLGPGLQAAKAAAAAVVLPGAGPTPWALLSADYQPVALGEAAHWNVAAGLAVWRGLVEKRETALPELAEGPWEGK